MLARLALVRRELDAARLTAPADQHLRLDHDRIANRVGRPDSILDARDGLTGGNPQSVAGEQLLALILQQIHCGAGL